MGERSELRDALAELRAELAAAREELSATDGRLGLLRQELTALRETVGGMQGWLERLDGDVGGQREWLQSSDDRIDDTAQSAARTEQAAAALGEKLSALERRVPDATPVYGEALSLERFDAGLGGEVVGYRGVRSGDADADVYRGFEDAFRGTEAEIGERQRAYLPLLAAPLLDVGCGRGELLELLAERGIAAEGIDLDAGMVDHCRGKGLENVTRADAVEYLEAAAPGALRTIFAAQVIEHLHYEALLAFLRAARAALAPGGRLIVETVNPHAAQALKHFWLDPTHQHPLFPEVVLVLCRLTGFDEAFIWHPQGTGSPDRDRVEQMDYAVVARTAGGS